MQRLDIRLGKAHLCKMICPCYLDIRQQNESAENTEVAHAHEQKVFQNGVGFHTAVDVLADVVEGFQVEVAGFQFRLNPFGRKAAGIEFFRLAVAGFVLDRCPLWCGSFNG